MGTYTTNYQLFIPSIGEQGWGDLVNGNFTTIDTTMAGLNTRIGTAESNITSLTSRMGTAETTITSNTSRIGALETEADAVEERVTVLEAGGFETVNVAGTITADEFVGGVGNFSSLVMPTLGYNNYATFSFLTIGSGTTSSSFTLFGSPFPISGTISLKTDTTRGAQVVIIGKNGTTVYNITDTQTEYTVTDAYSITVEAIVAITSQAHTITYGIPILT